VALVQRIVLHLAAQPDGGAPLPSGSLLTPRALQLLGLSGLGASGGFERLHYLLEAFFDEDGDMSPFFARSFEGWMPWETNPIYALLHEPIYCQGAAANWAAHRVREAEFRGEFDAVALAQRGERAVVEGVGRGWTGSDGVGRFHRGFDCAFLGSSLRFFLHTQHSKSTNQHETAHYQAAPTPTPAHAPTHPPTPRRARQLHG